MWKIEESIITDIQPEKIWHYWSNPTTWHQWDQEVESCEIDGEFATGTYGKLKPKGGPLVKFQLTLVSPYNRFIDEAKLPLTKLIFDHEIQQLEEEKIKITHRVSMNGALSFLFSKIMGKKIQKGLPDALKSLVKLTKMNTN